MEKFDQYLKHSKILYLIKTDLEGNYTYISPHFAEVFNLDPEKTYGTNSLLTIFKEDHQKCIDAVTKCYQNPNTYQKVSLRKPFPNGKLIWSQWEFYLATDEHHQPKEMICFGSCVSEKIQHLKLLKTSNEKNNENEVKYQTLFETTILAIILHTPDGKIYDANEVFCKMVGITKTNITDRNISEFTPETFREIDKAFFDLLIKKPTNSSYEKEFITTEGKIIPISVNPKIFQDQNGKIFIWSIIKDITERKQQKILLKQQKELLEQTAHIAKLGGWHIDLKSKKTEWTKEVYKIHDLEDDFKHNITNGIEFFHREDQIKISLALEKSAKFGHPFDLELRLISAKKIHKWVRVAGGAIHNADTIIALKGIIQDITQKKLTENTIYKQNTLLKDFYFTQSHIVRLPIANVLGLINLLDIITSEEDRFEIYKKIKFSVSQLDQIVTDFANKKIDN
ncbi:PAS domain-containing protein [Pedobacter cryophilus]|uniref:histidine kinase n=1 Tax=Pedobacter cryophilus TaxID=2571271 RepID=A0A4U1BZV7_9SPHI|nr:PAS domain S-box protein [Pedobacter cryophilus]TKB97056.1 PAS domain S-box protein [Pedobacter cryophilus]